MSYTYKQIGNINFPVMMSVLTEQLINISDAIFLGHVGEIELGASAIAGVYYLALYMIGFGFGQGLQVMIARKNGEQKKADAGNVFVQGLYCLIILSVLLFVLSELITSRIMSRLISSQEVYRAVMQYSDRRIYGLLFAFPTLAFRSFFTGITRTRILTISSSIMIFTNILLNYLLIFGMCGFPELGIAGAAIASSASELTALLILTVYAGAGHNKLFSGLKGKFDRNQMHELFRLSSWCMMQSFIGVAPWFLFFAAIEHAGKMQLATANILRSISSLFFVIVNSFAVTTSALVGNLVGSGNRNGVMKLCGKIIALSYLTGIPIIILAVVFFKKIFGIYTDNELLIDQAFFPYMVMLMNYFLAVPAYIYCNTVVGLGKTKTAFRFQVTTIVFYLIWLYFLTTLPNVPLAVFWTAEYLYVSVLLIQSLFFLKYSSQLKK